MASHVSQKPIGNGENVSFPKNYNQFVQVVRQYSERLREEKDLSLTYLNEINSLSEELRKKDQEIEKLKKVNKQLNQRLSIYNSVITRSRSISPLRMSTIIDKQNFTESIIERKEEGVELLYPKPFEHFFILDLSEKQNKLIKYRYAFQNKNQTFEEIVATFIDISEGPQWSIQSYGINNTHKESKSILSLYNSPFTTKQCHLTASILSDINPSYYYFLYVVVQKQLVYLNGRYSWTPIVYGMISYFPFPTFYFSLLEVISSFKPKAEEELKQLNLSLRELNNFSVSIPNQIQFNLMSKRILWKIPTAINSYVLDYSSSIMKEFSIQFIVDVLLLLLREIPITIISKSSQKVSQFMFFFIYIIKPLRYPYPIIFNLNQKMKILLESPFPTFTGTTNFAIVSEYLSERAVFDLDEKSAKSWPVIDNLDKSRQFLFQIGKKIDCLDRMWELTTEIIQGHQHKQLDTYWREFTKTQIYNNYIFHQ